MAHERTCVVCGKVYKYCKRCQQYKHLPTWMYAYCSEPCREIYLITNKYEFDHITAEEALEQLSRLKVKVANTDIQKDISEIKRKVNANKKLAEKQKSQEEIKED